MQSGGGLQGARAVRRRLYACPPFGVHGQHTYPTLAHLRCYHLRPVSHPPSIICGGAFLASGPPWPPSYASMAI